MSSAMSGPADERPGGPGPQPEGTDWPDLAEDPSPIIRVRRRPAWMMAVALILVLNGVTHLLFSQVSPDQVLAPEAGLVGAVALVAAVGIFLAASWGRLLAAGLAVYWLAQTAALSWSWIAGGAPSGGAAADSPILDLALPTAVYLAILVLVGLRWPDRD